MSSNTEDNLISAIREGNFERVDKLIASSGLSNALPWSDAYPLLREAISENKTKIVQLLLRNINPEIKSKRLGLTSEECGALGDIVNMIQYNILESAVLNSDSEMLRKLLDRCEGDRYLYMKSLLQFAVRKNKMTHVELLLKRGIDVNTYYKGLTPLLIAVHGGCNEIAEYLLNNGAYVDCACVIAGAYLTSLNFAIEKVNPTLVKLLLAHGATIDSRNEHFINPLKMAFERGDPIITAYIYVCSLEIKTTSRITLLNAVDRAKNQYREIFHCLFSYFCSDSFPNKKTLLAILIHAAAHGGWVGIVEYFVNIGFEINALTIYNPQWPDRQTLLHSAVKNSQISMAEFLIHNGSDVNAIDNVQKSPIFYAIEYGDVAMTELLIGCGAKIKNNSSLLRSASGSGYRQMVEIILKHDPNMDINAQDSFGNTALHSANIGSLHEDVGNEVRAEITKLLLDRGADVNARDRKDSTPLHFAAQRGRVEVIEMLLAHNADVNAVAAGDFDSTPLHDCVRYASDAESVVIVKMLLSKNADVEAKTKDGATALYHACERGYFKVVSLLLNHGANVNAACNDGTTALHIAFTKSYAETIEVLFKYGADINLKDNDGRTAPQSIISRYIDTEFYCPRKCRCKKIIDVFVKQIVKIKTAKLHVSEQNLDLMQRGNYTAAVTFEEECRKEIVRMRQTKISGNASFYDILMKDVHEIAIYVKYENVVKALESKNWKDDFPIYRGMIWKNFKNARDREILLNPSVDSFNFLIGHKFLDVLTIDILSYLNNEDLENLIEASRINRNNGRPKYVENTIKMLKNLFVGAKNFARKQNRRFN